MTRRVLVIADDLTGAMDAGSEFASRGFSTVVALGAGDGIEKRAERDVLAVDTDSRYAPPDVAARAVTEGITAYRAAIVYKKVDSTLRGNLLVEIEAAIAASGADLAVVAPAFPATGRTTVDGTHLVAGEPVIETLGGEERPTSANLPTLFEGSSYPVTTCSLERVNRGPEAIDERFRDASAGEPAIVVCDARSEEHLGAIARAAADLDRRVLPVGSAGLARHVRLPAGGSENGSVSDRGADDEHGGESTTAAGEEPTEAERTDGRGVLGLVGSANPRTIEQIGTLPTERVIALDVERAIDDPEAAAEGTSARAIEALSAGEMAVVTSVPDRESIEAARTAGAAAGVDEIGERIERALAAVAERTVAERSPGGVFLTGGAVAVRALRALDARGITLTGEAIERGVPIGRILGGRADGAAVITKAGGFGTERTIANCLARLDRGDE